MLVKTFINSVDFNPTVAIKHIIELYNMIREFQKITIVKVRKSSEKNINEDLQWISSSLGLFNERDKEKSCFRIFVELIKAARRGQALNSDQIAAKTNLSRAWLFWHS